MKITMKRLPLFGSIDQIKEFLNTNKNSGLKIEIISTRDKYQCISEMLWHIRFRRLSKTDRHLVFKLLNFFTGYSLSHAKRLATKLVNNFYKNVFNYYLNYHRPCGFAEIKTDGKGKEVKRYPKENYLTPYEKFRSLSNAEQYLKTGITFADLDKIAYAKSDIEYAKYMQEEKFKMLKIIQSNH